MFIFILFPFPVFFPFLEEVFSPLANVLTIPAEDRMNITAFFFWVVFYSGGCAVLWWIWHISAHCSAGQCWCFGFVLCSDHFHSPGNRFSNSSGSSMAFWHILLFLWRSYLLVIHFGIGPYELTLWRLDQKSNPKGFFPFLVLLIFILPEII